MRAAVYADDRSLKVSDSSDAEAVQRDKAALAVAAAFDEAAGLCENDTKHQFWRIGMRAEHLWLCQQVGGAAAGEEPSLTPPRGGWEGISAVIRRLFLLPGGLDVRAGITGACVLPKFAWAAPFIEQPPPELATSLLRALLRTACTWWCKARFWTSQVLLHPNLALAVRSLKAAAGLPQSKVLICAVQQHAARLHLVPRWDAKGNLWIRPRLGADARSWAAAAQVAGNAACEFDPASGAGAHALRSAARVEVLAFAATARSAWRNDQEGLEAADVEIGSRPAWLEWVKSLDRTDAVRLRIWRCGAV